MENLVIKKFDNSNPRDIEEILEIQKDAFLEIDTFPKEYLLDVSKDWPEGFLVAKVNEEIVGYIIGSKEKEVGLIISIAVKKEWRQKGIGGRLMTTLFENFKKEKVKIVFLHTREDNIETIKFYKMFGFKIRELVENYYSNKENAYLMEKIL